MNAASQESSLNLVIFLLLTPDRLWPRPPPGRPDLVLHFKKPPYHFCHARLPIVSHSGATGGPLWIVGVDVKMVGSEVLTLIVRLRVGGGTRRLLPAVRHGRENGTPWIGRGSGSGQWAAQLALKQEESSWYSLIPAPAVQITFFFFIPPALVLHTC